MQNIKAGPGGLHFNSRATLTLRIASPTHPLKGVRACLPSLPSIHGRIHKWPCVAQCCSRVEEDGQLTAALTNLLRQGAACSRQESCNYAVRRTWPIPK